MLKYLLALFSVFILNDSFAQKLYKYPKSPKDSSFIDVYFDSIVKDPYQWMENPNDSRLTEWISLQNKITVKEGHKHIKVRVLRAQIASLYSHVKIKTVDGYIKSKKKKSKYEFEYESKGYDRSPNLTYRLRGTKIFYTLVKNKDFKKEKDDHVVITHRYLNQENNLIAIEMSHNGSDWREIYVFDLITGKQLPDTIKNVRIGSKLIWHGRNFYYDNYDEPLEGRELLDKAKGQKLYYHKLGSIQSEDIMLFQNQDTTGTNSFSYFELKEKLFFNHFYKHKNKIFKAISVANNDPESFYLKNFIIYPNSDSIHISVKAIFKDTVYLKTDWNAPNGKILTANINELNKISEFVPEYDVVLRSVNRLGKDKIACVYRNEGNYLGLIFDLSGKLLKKIDFPEGKKVNYLYESDEKAEYTEFSVSSFFHPQLWYQISLKDLSFKPSVSVSVPYKPKDLETRYVKYKSKDGTEIPMYITCLKETKLNGKNPTLLYGYGGYGITVEPSFDESKALWLLHGGVLAIPNIRGGGAEGSNWAMEGRRLKKQNTIDDFIAAAEYLISEKYTNSNKLAINGGSHGGLLVGAAITQRPELFKAAVAEAGAFDMLRFEKYTVGSANTSINEFGSPSNFEDFINLKSYSPLHNVKKGVKYPNVLLITGDKDDRVPPMHSYKFLAELQENGDSKSLYHIYITPGSGHGGALTSKDFADKLLFKYYFLFDQLGLRFD